MNCKLTVIKRSSVTCIFNNKINQILHNNKKQDLFAFARKGADFIQVVPQGLQLALDFGVELWDLRHAQSFLGLDREKSAALQRDVDVGDVVHAHAPRQQRTPLHRQNDLSLYGPSQDHLGHVRFDLSQRKDSYKLPTVTVKKLPLV
jgi:hypothetical protein